VIMGDLMGGLLVERLASGGLGAGRIDCMADNPPDPHKSLLFLCFLVSNGVLASVSTN